MSVERATSWENKSRFIDEELEFYTELALHETERWIQVRPSSPAHGAFQILSPLPIPQLLCDRPLAWEIVDLNGNLCTTDC